MLKFQVINHFLQSKDRKVVPHEVVLSAVESPNKETPLIIQLFPNPIVSTINIHLARLEGELLIYKYSI